VSASRVVHRHVEHDIHTSDSGHAWVMLPCSDNQEWAWLHDADDEPAVRARLEAYYSKGSYPASQAALSPAAFTRDPHAVTCLMCLTKGP
jgi:hypothetical protein